jgi:hypothetical protein
MRALVLVAVVAACGGDPIDLVVSERYWEDPAWKKVTTSGSTPGHGNTIRDIYANAIAQNYDPFNTLYYEDGAILVKEVYTNEHGTRGELEAIEIMRRIGLSPMSHDDYLGWLFSVAGERNGSETDETDFCWRRCHVNAPVAGAWLDYGR